MISSTEEMAVAVKLIVFGSRALQGTLLHLWLDRIRVAGIEMGVMGASRDSREVQNTAVILNTAYVAEAEEDGVAARMTILSNFGSRAGVKESEMMVVSLSEAEHTAARVMHLLYSTPLGLEMLLTRAGSVEKAMEFFA